MFTLELHCSTSTYIINLAQLLTVCEHSNRIDQQNGDTGKADEVQTLNLNCQKKTGLPRPIAEPSKKFNGARMLDRSGTGTGTGKGTGIGTGSW